MIAKKNILYFFSIYKRKEFKLFQLLNVFGILLKKYGWGLETVVSVHNMFYKTSVHHKSLMRHDCQFVRESNLNYFNF